MKFFLISLLCLSLAIAQELPAPANPKETQTARKELLNEIFSQLTPPAFEKAIQKARTAAIPEQVLLEARFLHLIDQNDQSNLAKLAPQLIAFRDKFDLSISEVFGVKEDWLSVIHYTQALAALEKEDAQEFKKHITEAFWLNPRHAQIYAPHIEQLRLKQAMANITIPGDLHLQPQKGGAPITLQEIQKGKAATVLHFWSPISQEVSVNMPDFILTSRTCAAHGIGVISVLIDDSPEALKDAEIVRQKNHSTAQCHWIKDTPQSALTNTLRIANIPTMVILSTEGKVLFNGHPSEPAFWQTIEKIAPQFKRPNKPEQEHKNN